MSGWEGDRTFLLIIVGGITESSGSTRPITGSDFPSCPRELKIPESMEAVNKTAAPPFV